MAAALADQDARDDDGKNDAENDDEDWNNHVDCEPTFTHRQ